jgi:hypothetical protein
LRRVKFLRNVHGSVDAVIGLVTMPSMSDLRRLQSLWVAGCVLLLAAVIVAAWRQRPLRPTAAFFVGTTFSVGGLVFTAVRVWEDPIAICQVLSAVSAVFLIVGRGRPLDVIPADYLAGWHEPEERRRHKEVAARRERELMFVSVGAVACGSVWAARLIMQ